jgi:hypothetical protein
MLAEEQAVIHRGAGLKKEVEGAFGLGGETEGTLILTDRRLIYAHKAAEEEVDLPVGLFTYKSLFIDDVEGLDSMSNDSEGLEIPLSRIVRAEGHGGRVAIAPKLEVEYCPIRRDPLDGVRRADDGSVEEEEPQRLSGDDKEAQGRSGQAH